MAALLTGVYFGFRLVTSPFLDVEPKRYDVPAGVDSRETAPEVLDAGRWFPNHSWVSQANEQYFDEGRVLYCERSELSEDRKSITLSPVAMQWVEVDAAEDEVPVTMVADSATLNLERALSTNDSQLGRVLSGRLKGRVQIMGPRGLNIVGHDFAVTEESMKFWSSQPIQFQWEGHRGNASSGAEIHLSATDSGGGLTKVDDIRRVGLLGRVNVHFRMPPKRRGDEGLDLRITAARGFTFDMLTRTGRFTGLLENRIATAGKNQTLPKRDQVWVKQVNPNDANETLNQLVCPELVLNFRNRVVAPGTETSDGPALELERIRAWGRRVVFLSNQQDLLVDGNDFRYSLDERRIDISRTSSGLSNDLQSVTVISPNGRLSVPHINIMLAAVGNEVQRVQCLGRGVLTGRAPQTDSSESPDDAEEFRARWSQSMVMKVLPNAMSREITIEGDASVNALTRAMTLSAHRIAMLLKETPGQQAGVVRPAVAKAETSDADLGDLQPERLVAEGNVRLESPSATGNLRERLVLDFEVQPEAAVKTVSASTESQASSKRETADPMADLTGGMSFVADTLDARIILSADQENAAPDFRDLWLKGSVEVVRQSENPDDSFSATGNALSAARGLADEREVHLFGDPAVISSATRKLEGQRIDFKEIEQSADVVGSGRIRFVISTGFDGKPLPAPTPLDLYWSDHMSFRGQSAKFIGNVRVVMSDGTTQDLQLTCSGMTVHFSEDVLLNRDGESSVFSAVPQSSSSGEARQTSPIERIECHNKVDVHIEQYLDGVINGRHDAVVADLNVNLITGDFTAMGPGSLQSASPDRNGALQGSAPLAARANAAAQTVETAFIRVKTTFIGELKGNLHQRTALLTQNVLATVTPTRRVDEQIDLQNIARDEMPERAGILQAEHLTLSSLETDADAPAMFSVVARNNARLVSKSIAASADVITYDHSKEQFIMRAEGDGRVKVSHRTGATGRSNSLTGNRFEYYRRTNRLKATEIEGLNIQGVTLPQ